MKQNFSGMITQMKKPLEKRASGAEWKLNIQFEHKAQETPQNNHLFDIGFSNTFNK